MKYRKRRGTFACAILLALTLVLSACDMGAPVPADTQADIADQNEDAVIIVDEVETDTTDIVTDTDAITDTEIAADVASTSQTDLMGGTAVWTLGYELIERSFTNVDGEISGSVEDLVVDLRTGAILLAEIEYGGFLDLGDREILVPLAAFRESVPGEELILRFDEGLLENYPDLGERSPRLDDPAWYADIATFWGDIVSGDETGQMRGMDLTTVDVTSDPIVRATDLLGFSLVDLGDGVGTIQNMLINMAGSRARYLMVSYGTGVADDAPFLIPFSAIDIVNIDTTEITLDANITMDTLLLAPRFDRFLFEEEGIAGGPIVIDDAFISEVDSFWEEQGLSVAQ